MTLAELLTGWSNTELRRRTCLSRETIAAAKLGRRVPTFATLRRLADGLGVDVAVVADAAANTVLLARTARAELEVGTR